MAGQVLYLKWRPQRFEDVVGQDHVTQTLKNALRAGRIAHAYLFAGPRGTGKTTMARLLAKAVNCLDEDVNRRPCNECHICRAIGEGRLLDLIEMDAASHTGVDNVREAIRDKVGFRPSEARYKVYVIDEVHMLSTSAFNALLKTLEEPPAHVIFCLATTEPHKILPTILSRCQRFDFRRIPLSALVARLQHIAGDEGIRIDKEALQFIARTATGCARDAISLLDQLAAYGDEVITVERVRSVLGLSDVRMVHDLASHLAARDIGGGLAVISRAVDQGGDTRQFTQQVVDYLRSILLLRVGGDAIAPDMDAQTWAAVGDLAGEFSTRGLLRAIKLFNEAQLELRASDQGQLALELAFVEAAMTDEGGTLPAAPSVPAQRAPPRAEPPRSSPAAAPQVQVPSVPTAAPPRSAKAVPESAPPAREMAKPPPIEAPAGAVTLEEVDQVWSTEVRQVFRDESWANLFSLLDSAATRRIKDGNQIVFEFTTEVVASKLTDEKSRIAEGLIRSVLGKPCRVRGVAQAASPTPAGARPSDPRSTPRAGQASPGPGSSSAGTPSAQSEQGGARDPYLEARSDPIVQDLIKRGGQVTDVQVLPEE